MPKVRCWAAVGLLFTGLSVSPMTGSSQAAPVSRVDDASHRVFGLAAKKYESLAGMRCSFRISRTGARALTGKFSYATLGKANLEWVSGGKAQRCTTNGDVFYRVIDGRYYTESMSPGMMGLIAVLWNRLPTSAGRILDPLFSGISPAGQLAGAMTISARRSGGEMLLRGVHRGLGAGLSKTTEMYFGSRDNLLHRVVETSQAKGRKYVVTTSFTGIELNPRLASSTFEFRPGKKYKPYPVEAVRPKPKKPVLALGEKPLPIVGKDLYGKTRSLEDYKGKILLVDFWATWCGPCVGELPNVQAMYNRYHSRGFEVLAVSLDEDRSALVNFVKARKMPWPQIYSGKGWEDPNARRYAVQGIPYTMLIGPDGTIAAFDPRGSALEKEIQKFMKGWA